MPASTAPTLSRGNASYVYMSATAYIHVTLCRYTLISLHWSDLATGIALELAYYY